MMSLITQQQHQHLDHNNDCFASSSIRTMVTSGESQGTLRDIVANDDDNMGRCKKTQQESSSIPTTSAITTTKSMIRSSRNSVHNNNMKKSNLKKTMSKKETKEEKDTSKVKKSTVSKLITPCSTMKAFRKSYVRRMEEGYRNELIQLCRKQHNDRDIISSTIYPIMERILKESPILIHDCIDNVSGYNLLQLVCTNPTLANNISIIKLLIETSMHVTNQEQMKMEMKAMKKQKKLGSRRMISRKSSIRDIQLNNTNIPKLMLLKSINNETILHLICMKYPLTHISFDTMEYIIKYYIQSLQMIDQYNASIPFHYICSNASIMSVPFDIILLLVHHYPQCCTISNGDGDLPLHLLCNITSSITTNQTIKQVKVIIDRNKDNDKSFFMDSMCDLQFDDIDGTDDEHTDDDMTNDDVDCEVESTEGDNYNNESFTNDTNNHDSTHSGSYPSLKKKIRRKTRRSNNSKSTYTQNVILPSTMISDHVRLQQEYQEQIRYEKQLELIEYVVALYPDALNVRNDFGLTPLQVAMTTSSKQKQLIQKSKKHITNNKQHDNDIDDDQLENRSLDAIHAIDDIEHNNDEDDDHLYPWNKIIEFLHNPNIEKSRNIVEGFADHNDSKFIKSLLQTGEAMMNEYSTHNDNNDNDHRYNINFILGKLSGHAVDDPILLSEQGPAWRQQQQNQSSNNPLMKERFNKIVDNCLHIDMNNSYNTTTSLQKTLIDGTSIKNNNKISIMDDDPLLLALQALQDASERDTNTRYRNNNNNKKKKPITTSSSTIKQQQVQEVLEEEEKVDDDLDIMARIFPEQQYNAKQEHKLISVASSSPSSSSKSSSVRNLNSSFSMVSTVVATNYKTNNSINKCNEKQQQYQKQQQRQFSDIEETFSVSSEVVVIEEQLKVQRISSSSMKRTSSKHSYGNNIVRANSNNSTSNLKGVKVVEAPIQLADKKCHSFKTVPSNDVSSNSSLKPKDDDDVCKSSNRNIKPISSPSKKTQEKRQQQQPSTSLAKNDINLSSDHNSSLTASSCSTLSSKHYTNPEKQQGTPLEYTEQQRQHSAQYLAEPRKVSKQQGYTQQEYWPIASSPTATKNHNDRNDSSSRMAAAVDVMKRSSKNIQETKSPLPKIINRGGPDYTTTNTEGGNTKDFQARIFVPKHPKMVRRCTDTAGMARKGPPKMSRRCTDTAAITRKDSSMRKNTADGDNERRTASFSGSAQSDPIQYESRMSSAKSGSSSSRRISKHKNFAQRSPNNLIDFDDDGYTKARNHAPRNLIDFDESDDGGNDNSC